VPTEHGPLQGNNKASSHQLPTQASTASVAINPVKPCKEAHKKALQAFKPMAQVGASASGFHAEDAEVISTPACQHGSANMVLHNPSSSLMLHTTLAGEHAAAVSGNNQQR